MMDDSTRNISRGSITFTWIPRSRLTSPVRPKSTETAARVHYAITHGKIRIDELRAPEKTLHIDSKVLEKAEAREEVGEIEISPTNGDEDEADEMPTKKLSKK